MTDYVYGNLIKVKNKKRPLIDDYEIHYVIHDFGDYIHTHCENYGIYVQSVNKEDILEVTKS